MKKKEYSDLCVAIACLNMALCAMDEKFNVDFTDPKKTAREETLKAYRLIDRMLINKGNEAR